jgi:hypothetical protein
MFSYSVERIPVNRSSCGHVSSQTLDVPPVVFHWNFCLQPAILRSNPGLSYFCHARLPIALAYPGSGTRYLYPSLSANL